MLKLVAVGAERTELVIDVRKPNCPFATPDNVYLVAYGDELEWIHSQHCRYSTTQIITVLIGLFGWGTSRTIAGRNNVLSWMIIVINSSPIACKQKCRFCQKPLALIVTFVINTRVLVANVSCVLLQKIPCFTYVNTHVPRVKTSKYCLLTIILHSCRLLHMSNYTRHTRTQQEQIT